MISAISWIAGDKRIHIWPRFLVRRICEREARWPSSNDALILYGLYPVAVPPVKVDTNRLIIDDGDIITGGGG
jgi:hypothetical protein